MANSANRTGPPPLGDVVEKLGYGGAHARALVLGGGVWAADGAELLLIGSVTRAVNEEWNLSSTQRGMIVSVVFVGVLVGNLLSGNLGDSFGRRFPIVISYFGVFVFSLMSLLAYDFYSMSTLRFLVGISFGVGQPAWNAMSGEISPCHRRLHMSGYSQILFSLGEIYSAFLIWYSDPRMKRLDWRWLVGMGAGPSIFFGIFAYLFLLESPCWLAHHNRKSEALLALEEMRRQNGLPASFSVDFKNPPARDESRIIAHGVLDSVSIILGKKLFFTTVVTGISCYTLNLLFYGGLYAFPQILPGIESRASPAISLIIGAVLEIPGYLFGLFVGIYLTRKHGILFYLGLTFVAMVMFAISANAALMNDGRITGWMEIVLHIGFNGNKIGTAVGFLIIYCYSTEIYPTRARATGSAICLAMGRLGGITCPVIFEWLTESTGTPITFIYFMLGCMVANACLIFFLTIETSGMIFKDDDFDEAAPLSA